MIGSEMWTERDLDHISKVAMFEAYTKIKVGNSLRAAKMRCRDTDLDFDITAEDLMPFPLYCPVLGIKLDWFADGRGGNDNSPSIDRLDPAKGYVAGNVEIISNRANRIKNDAQLEEVRKLVLWMERRKTIKKGGYGHPEQLELGVYRITSPSAQ